MRMTPTTSIQKNTTKSSREVMMVMFRGPAFLRHVCSGKKATSPPENNQPDIEDRYVMKKYVPNKPNPVGLKNIVLEGNDGVIYSFGIYKGRETFSDMGFGVAGNSVLAPTQIVPTCSAVYFDRLSTSSLLVDELVKKKIFAAGTVMKNRIPKRCKPCHRQRHDEEPTRHS
ncbi:hypothetical protein HPB47_014896 [Ixodes persulcatus]|uniref:Uncharacterized protein n=1 Tax=Ixodes persulcatus TaxID=34615 RepID=A0AC60QUY6_IXOPE|nr:hypothetical protein HPB47_014896 [Ixodes persulcatus]